MEELAVSVDLFLDKPREVENQKLICAACAADKSECICPDDRRDRKATKRRTRCEVEREFLVSSTLKCSHEYRYSCTKQLKSTTNMA